MNTSGLDPRLLESEALRKFENRRYIAFLSFFFCFLVFRPSVLEIVIETIELIINFILGRGDIHISLSEFL